MSSNCQKVLKSRVRSCMPYAWIHAVRLRDLFGTWQEALDLCKSEVAGAYSLARLTAAADTVAAVASATYGGGGDSQLSLPALEQPCLDCLQALCADVRSCAWEGSEGALATLSSCVSNMLRMCLQLKYSMEEQVSHMPPHREKMSPARETVQ